MTKTPVPAFDEPSLLHAIQNLSAEELEGAPFGVIGFDGEGVVRLYNTYESKASGLSMQSVVGQELFTVVAPCMNNFLVSQRFEDAAAEGSVLDATIDFLLTLRMRPTRVKLRMLSLPGATYRFVLVHRLR